MLSWIPIIGPIIQGIVSIFVKAQDVKVVQIKNKTAENIALAESSIQLTTAFKDNIGVRLSRDLVLFPVCIWTALTVWDSIVVHHWPNLVWVTSPILKGSGLEFLPYAVMVFLFGNLALNARNR